MGTAEIFPHENITKMECERGIPLMMQSFTSFILLEYYFRYKSDSGHALTVVSIFGNWKQFWHFKFVIQELVILLSHLFGVVKFYSE